LQDARDSDPLLKFPATVPPIDARQLDYGDEIVAFLKTLIGEKPPAARSAGPKPIARQTGAAILHGSKVSLGALWCYA
jgi:hypothetical protein